MAGPDDGGPGDGERPTRRAPDRSTYVGIGATVLAVLVALVVVAVLFGAFDEENVVEQTDNTMMGGSVTGAGVEDVVEDEALIDEETAAE